MIHNYLKLSLRLLRRNPFFTLLNVIGLSVGFTVFLVLWQYSQSELNSDHFHNDWQQIARFYWSNENVDESGYVKEVKSSGNHPAFYNTLASVYPEFADQTKICIQQQFRRTFIGDHDNQIFFSYVTKDGTEKSFLEKKLIYADPNLFEFFSLPLLKGNPEKILQDPNSIVLNEDLAKKYFGENDPVGEVLTMNDSLAFMVSGVFKNLPANTHLDFEAVMSAKRIEKNTPTYDLSQNAFFNCYFKLPVGSNRHALTAKINDAKIKYIKEEAAKYKIKIEDCPIELQPIEEAVFNKTVTDSYFQKTKFFLHVLSSAAFVVLIMAWINYVNLSIVAYRRRSKEMAARLSSGARIGNLMVQFMTEALVLNLISLGVAFTFIQIIDKPVQLLFHFYLPTWSQTTTSSVLVIFGVLLTGIIISGTIPAAMASRHTIQGLFGSAKALGGKTNIRTVMMQIQFVIAIVLAVGTFVVSDQLSFVIKRSLGEVKNNIIVLDLPFILTPTFKTDLHTFENEIENIPGVQDWAVSSSTIGENDWNSITLQKNSQSQFLFAGTNGGVDERYIPFYSLRLLAGRNFIKDNPADQSSIIISKKLMERLGITTPQDAIGMKILSEEHEWMHDMKSAVIIGVIEDYVRLPLLTGFGGYFTDDAGTAFTNGNSLDAQNQARKFSIRLETRELETTVKKIESKFHESFKVSPFNWYFLDDFVNSNYQSERVAKNQILLFASIGIGIACLGLLGMISNKVVEKRKEIGIRKVLGAELHQIAAILFNATLMQILIATIIGIPMAYYLTQQYLEKFSQRITLQWWTFALPVLMVLIIMTVTVLWVLWKAAKSNPIEALKYE